MSTLLLLSLVGPARADLITLDDVRQMVVELRPEVEAVAGRRLVEVPAVGIATSDQVLRQVQAFEAERLRARGGGDGAAQLAAASAYATGLLEHALAVYLESDGSLVLIKDHLERNFSETLASPDLAEASLRCVVAHELVHALQQQYAATPLALTEEQSFGARALREGQAVLISSRVCQAVDPQVARYVAAVAGTDVVASIPDPDDNVLAYGYAPLYLAGLEHAEGREAVWQALSGAPPSREALVVATKPWLQSGWPALLALDARALHQEELGRTFSAGPTSPYFSLLPFLSEEASQEVLAVVPDALGGAEFVGDGSSSHLRLVAFDLLEAEGAERWMARRQADALAWEDGKFRSFPWAFSGFSWQVKVSDSVPPAARQGFDGALWIHSTGTGGYRELWVRRGTALLGAFWDGYVSRGEILESLTTLAEHLPDARDTGPLEARRWMAAGSTRGVVDAPLSWTFSLDRALADAMADRFPACLGHVDEALAAAPDAEARRQSLALAYACAAFGSDLARADGLVAEGDARSFQDPRVKLAHAWLRLQVGRYEQTLALLDGLAPLDAATARYASEIRLGALLGLRRWKEATALAVTGAGTPELRMSLAGTLFQQGRLDSMAAVLSATCSEITDAGNRGRCEALRRSVAR